MLKKLHKNNQVERIKQILNCKDNHYIERQLEDFIKTYTIDEDVIRMLFTCIPRCWWNFVVKSQKLSENFIREFKDKIDMLCVGNYQVMDEKFLEEMKNKVAFKTVARYHNLSEEFIERHSEEIDWYFISSSQTLSEQFLEKHIKQIIWLEYFYRNARVDNLSKDFIKKHLNEIFTRSDIARSFLWQRNSYIDDDVREKLRKIADEN